MKKPKILFFTKYDFNGPSSRYRIIQYLTLYNNNGFETNLNCLLGNWYFKRSNRFLFFINILSGYLKRLFFILNACKYDIIYIEYELFPYFPPLFEYLFRKFKIKFILDFDDAIFLNYQHSNNFYVRYFFSSKIEKIISYSNSVITGSPFLTNYAKQFNKNTIEIPTSLNAKLYPKYITKSFDKFTIGWIGSKSTSNNLIPLINVFRLLSSKYDYKIVLIGFDNSLKNLFSEDIPVEFIDWSPHTEIQNISKFDVGIMPLENNTWNLGKCGFKLIQYMACSKPTISSALPANIKINRDSRNLFANSENEWLNAFTELIEKRDFFYNVGIYNYSIFLKYYSIDENLKMYLKLFKSL